MIARTVILGDFTGLAESTRIPSSVSSDHVLQLMGWGDWNRSICRNHRTEAEQVRPRVAGKIDLK
jgi:hypothetical protein